MQLDLMDAGVNPYCTIVADCQKPPSYFGFVSLHVLLSVVILHHRTKVTILPLVIVILSYAELTLLLHQPVCLLALIVRRPQHQQRLPHAPVGLL